MSSSSTFNKKISVFYVQNMFENKNSAQGYVPPGKDMSHCLSDNTLYLYQVLPKYLTGFQSYRPGPGCSKHR